MSQESEMKTCKMCGMEIPAVAKKCPYCHCWQHWMSFQNPAIMIPVVFIPMIVFYAVIMECTVGRMTREWELFPKHCQEVGIVEDKMEFGGEPSDPAVVVVGKVKNDSQVDWKDVRFQVDFFNPKGELFDTGQQEAYTYRLPAGQECPFKVSFRRQFPEKEYAKHTVRIISAVDSRTWP